MIRWNTLVSAAVLLALTALVQATQEQQSAAESLETRSPGAMGADDGSLSVEEIVDRLKGPSAEGGLRLEPGTRGFRAAPRLVLQSVTFEFDSHRLTREAERILERIAAALQDERLKGERFRIEGHTDASGDPAYNLELSERRAGSVRAYLVGRGLESDAFDVVGRGEGALLAGEEPGSPRNRRVEIIRIET